MLISFKKRYKSKLVRWFLQKLLLKKCCKEIPMSGEKVKSVDCYVVYIRNKSGEIEYLVNRVSTEKDEVYVDFINHGEKSFNAPETIPLSDILEKQTSVGYYYKGYKFEYNSIPETIQLSDILKKQISVCYYYKGYQFDYNSTYELLLKYLTKYDKAKINLLIVWNSLAQSRFNRKMLTTPHF